MFAHQSDKRFVRKSCKHRASKQVYRLQEKIHTLTVFRQKYIFIHFGAKEQNLITKDCFCFFDWLAYQSVCKRVKQKLCEIVI